MSKKSWLDPTYINELAAKHTDVFPPVPASMTVFLALSD